MPTYGVTAAGFAAKPLSAILSDMQTQVLATINSEFDLSPQTPDGQMLGIVAAQAAACWELLQIAYNQYNRQDVEGAGLDNLGDVTGSPRESASYTQVYCNVTLAAGNYAANQLVANIAGAGSQTFTNVFPIVSAGGVVPGVLFQSTTIGATPSVNPGTLTVITTPVTGWTAITNPTGQSQLGTNAELDAAYSLRQSEDLAASGSCNPSALAEAIAQLGAAQNPPQQLNVQVLDNPLYTAQLINGIGLPPRSFAVVVYDGGNGWAGVGGAGQSLIGQQIWNEKPTGIGPVGTIPVTIIDPLLGPQTVYYLVPTGRALYIRVLGLTVRPGVNLVAVEAAIQSELVAAAIAPTPASGEPAPGQLVPGATVYQAQLEAVVMGVPGVLNVGSILFDFVPTPTNFAPLAVFANQIATVAATNIAFV